MMKWKNKGHEFDLMYKDICMKNKFYLFGAGDYGSQFYQAFKNEIFIIGYIDNDEEKKNQKMNGQPCNLLSEIEIDEKTGIILTMSQIARTEPMEQLIECGYKKNIDFFIIEEFISVYHVYKYDKVYFSSISFLPSTLCNLKCKHCLNFNTFTDKFYIRDWKAVTADIDLFFSCVDYIMLFHVSGGEPMLYKYFADLMLYIDKNYGDRIDTLRTVTNGTILPSNETLEKLSMCNMELAIDDYREAVPRYKDNFDKLIEKMEKYKIKYYINKVDSWIDLGTERMDYPSLSEEKLIMHFDSCSQSWQELRDGKLYSCNYDAYATLAGINEVQDKEIYDLKKFIKKNKKELVEFRLGFNEKGYTSLCKKCLGFTKYNIEKYMPAEQV